MVTRTCWAIVVDASKKKEEKLSEDKKEEKSISFGVSMRPTAGKELFVCNQMEFFPLSIVH